MAKLLHLALTRFEGRADLQCPDHGLVVCNVPVQFDPIELVFEIQLPASHDLLQELADDHSIKLNLSNVALDSSELGVQLEAAFLNDLFRQNALSERPESTDGRQSLGLDASGPVTRRLLLGPNKRKIIFTALASLDKEHPYQIFYSNAYSGLWPPADLLLDGRATAVRFDSKNLTPGFICVFADVDFFPEEKRIQAALQLIHGRHLPTALMVQGRQITFYGHRAEKRLNYLPLVKDDHDARHLTDAVLAAFAAMPPAQFESMRYALSFFLLGKQADAPLEVHYLLLMTCVEAMDGQQSLQTDSTSWMLGVSGDAAKLVNGMRHQLTHGKGGYKQAFDAVIAKQFKNVMPKLEPALKACITEQGQLDFAVLWLRVCERIDAFWCARLGVSASLAKHRYSSLSLMDLPVLVPPSTSAAKSSRLSEARLKIEQLRLENQRLTQEIDQQNLKSTARETEYADIKQQLQTFEKNVLEAKSREKSG